MSVPNWCPVCRVAQWWPDPSVKPACKKCRRELVPMKTEPERPKHCQWSLGCPWLDACNQGLNCQPEVAGAAARRHADELDAGTPSSAESTQ